MRQVSPLGQQGLLQVTAGGTGGRAGNVKAVLGKSHLPAPVSLGKSAAGAGLSSIHAGLDVGLGQHPEDKAGCRVVSVSQEVMES